MATRRLRSSPFSQSVPQFVWLQCLAGVAQALTAMTDAPYSFQGYYVNPAGSAQAINCGTGSVFAMSSTFAGCCDILEFCNFPTTCIEGKATNRKGSVWSCGDRSCYTMTVYGEFPSATNSWVVHNCAETWSASTIYRSVSSTTTTAGGEGSSTSTAMTAGGVAAGASSTSNADSKNEESSEKAGVSSSPQHSQSWIAGIVMGSIAAAIALGALGFWLGVRRRRRRDGLVDGGGRRFNLFPTAPVRPGEGGSYENIRYPPPCYDTETTAKPRGNNSVVAKPVEMAASGRSHAELDAGQIRRKFMF